MTNLSSITVRGVLLSLLSIMLVTPAAGQSLIPPYPGARLLTSKHQGFIAFRISAAPGRYRYAQETGGKIKVESFTTPAAFDRVFTHLKYISDLKYQVTSKDLDPSIRAFIRSLQPAGLTALAQAVGRSLSGRPSILFRCASPIPGFPDPAVGQCDPD